jgi:hypothetical protein
MRPYGVRIPLGVSAKSVTLWCVFWGITGPTALSQESPAPPTPHTGPVLSGTHVPPRPLSPKPGIVLHIDAPATVNQKKCGSQTFDIKYSVINDTSEPANGTIRAAFNGVSLTPAGSAKLSNLPPGKQTSGAFSACCPSSGSFMARIEYHRNEPSAARNKATGDSDSVSDSVNISCVVR